MLRRHLLTRGVAAGAAATLWTTIGNPRLTFAEPLDATAASVPGAVWHGAVKASGASVRTAPAPGASRVVDLAPGTPVDIDRWVALGQLLPERWFGDPRAHLGR